MKKEESIHRLPKSFFEKERPIAEKEFDDDYVPFDWVEQIEYEESKGKKINPKIKRILGMEVREEEIPYEE